MKVITLNVNGIRAAIRKGFFDWLRIQKPDVVCLQEIRIQESQLTEEMHAACGMHSYYHCAEKPGYSGVAIYTKDQPRSIQTGLGLKEFDSEGRMLQIDFKDLSVISLYIPSGSAKENRQIFKYKCMKRIKEYMLKMNKENKNFIFCGDFNIAHTKFDLKNWRGNQKNSGFLPEEREWMTQLLENGTLIDNFRHLHPSEEGAGYTWWSNRGQAFANNTGWRIDYQISNEKIAQKLTKIEVYKDERFSDHAPLIAKYRI